MKTIIKFYPEEKIDIDLFLKRIREFGEIYKDNDLNIISNEKNYGKFYITYLIITKSLMI
jgi:hypothetical protein